MGMKYPLPRAHFECPPLEPDQIAQFQATAQHNCLDLIRHARLVKGPIQWTRNGHADNVQIYKGVDRAAPPGTITFCAVTEVLATTDEVASLFHTNTNHAYLDYCRMFAKDIVDSQCLYSLTEPTPDAPCRSVGVKWAAFECPVLLGRSRDFCFLESQHDFEINGKQGWVRALNFINLTCCPPLESTHQIVRVASPQWLRGRPC
ncbi:hypothetical protein LEN26_021105 [Aphanomyces euteiches]|nr:hypothetical protein LEN26_021105 [Aphanomyces euteiches]KAH9126377.1 hypothetical protein AeMF1_003191 [Aphanomyces euteiches]KAH9185080.1 hypothetical protein AeNC1_012944 [Aphanomyces euteiches]